MYMAHVNGVSGMGGREHGLGKEELNLGGERASEFGGRRGCDFGGETESEDAVEIIIRQSTRTCMYME